MTEEFLSVSWGGGVNSTALVLGLLERGVRPDVILFADTGRRNAEKPETYTFLDLFSPWLAARGFPEITVVHNDGMHQTLEQNCLTKKTLPSLAFGWRSCSEKYKVRPQLKYLKQRFGDLSRVLQAVGIHMDEAHRAKTPKNPPRAIFPLIDWEWGQEECHAAIQRHGLPLPQKSACFFCPASTVPEIRWLQAHHPDLLQRALAMEANAADQLTSIKGLGRRFSWRDLIEGDGSTLKMLPPVIETPCICFDGE